MDRAQENDVVRHNMPLLNDFRLAGLYTDFVVECEGQRFACHRVILAAKSAYFHAMFSSDIRENRAGIAVLRGIRAELFQYVLEFIYTEQIAVNQDNVCELLQTSEYFQLPDLEDKCVKFVRLNRIVSETLVDMFAFALLTNRKTLLEFLGDDIAAQLRTLSRTARFLAMLFDDLVTLFDLLPSPANEEVQHAAIVRWIQHRPEERTAYYGPLFSRYGFQNLSLQYLRFVASNLYSPAAVPTSHESSRQLVSAPAQAREVSLYIYVKNGIRSIVTFAKESGTGFRYSNRMPVTGNNDRQWIRSVVMNDLNVYSLQYARKTHQIGHQSFTAYPSANLNLPENLRAPPVVVEDVSMCSVHNNIYLYERSYDTALMPPPVRSDFTLEEIERAIYTYNCELDEWYPVPAMRKRVVDASVVSCGDILYVIGGRDATKLSAWECAKEIQCYDPRTPTWQKLTGKLLSNHVDADCCVLQGKIYACGGSTRNGAHVVQRYDPTAGRWQYVASMSKKYRRVVSFSNEIWAMGNDNQNDSLDSQTTVSIYDPGRNVWKTSSALKNAIQTARKDATTANLLTGRTFTVLDSIVI